MLSAVTKKLMAVKGASFGVHYVWCRPLALAGILNHKRERFGKREILTN